MSIYVSAYGELVEVKRGNNANLACSSEGVPTGDIDAVKWFFIPQGSDQEMGILEWNRTHGSKPGPILFKTNPNRYAFNNETYELNILFTNFGDFGLYSCHGYQILNESEVLLFDHKENLVVNGL